MKNLIQHQIDNPPKSRKPDNELKYEGQDLYTIICYGKHSEMILSHWDSAEKGTNNIKPKSDLKQLRKDLKWMRKNNPDFEYKLVKLVEIK